MIRFRNQHPAFNGELLITEDREYIIQLKWMHRDEFCELSVDLKNGVAEITYSDKNLKSQCYIV